MAESTLSLDFEGLGESTAHYLGWGRRSSTDDGLTSAQAANVTAANNAGMRDFLAAHDWAFLRPRANFTLWSEATGTVTATYSSPSSTVTATQPKFYSSMVGRTLLIDVITNGDFDADSDWTKGSGWTISGGEAVATGAISTDLEQASTLIVGTTYRLTYTVSVSAGSITPYFGAASGTTRSASGTYTEDVAATSTTTFKFTGSSFTGTIDDVSVETVNTISSYTSSTVIVVTGECTCTSKPFTIEAGTYRLPDNFGSMASTHISFEAGNDDDRRILLTAEPLVVDALQIDDNAARPTMAGIRPLSTDGTTGQRFDLVVHPIPDENYTVSFQYELNPDALTTGLYPYGGRKYAEIIRKACIAAAESMFNDHQTVKRAEYKEALARAIQDDLRSNRSDRLGRARPRQRGRFQYPEYDDRITAGTIHGVSYDS